MSLVVRSFNAGDAAPDSAWMYFFMRARGGLLKGASGNGPSAWQGYAGDHLVGVVSVSSPGGIRKFISRAPTARVLVELFSGA
jgi:hypothetical protein